jgi:hypothetical protein
VVSFADLRKTHPNVDPSAMLGVQWTLSAPANFSCKASLDIRDVSFVHR